MRRNGLILVLIIALLALEFPQPALAEAWPKKSGRTVTPISDGLQVVWQSSEPQPVQTSAGTYAVQMNGIASEQTPGKPQLPVDTLLVALPPGANPGLEIQNSQTVNIPKPYAIGRVSDAIAVPDGKDRSLLDLTPPIDPDLAPVVLQEMGVARGVRLARLVFHPVQLMGDELQVTQRIQVIVHFGSPIAPAQAGEMAPIPSDPYLDTLIKEVVNPGQVIAAKPAMASGASSGIANRAGQVVIEVARPGLTAVSYTDLIDAGFPVGAANPHYLHLNRDGVEIPIEWDGDDDNSFEAGERLLFYAQPRFSRWTANDVYFLSVTTMPSLLLGGRTMDSAGKPAGTLSMDQLFEENNIYTPDCYCAPLPAGRDGDRWVWDVLRQPDRTSADYPFDLTAADNTQPARLTIWLIGYTDIDLSPDHRVQVRLNGTLLDTVEFNGKQAVMKDIDIPAGVLSSTANTLTLTLPGVGSLVEGVWLDAFSLHTARNSDVVNDLQIVKGDSVSSNYTLAVASSDGLRVYDVTDADAPVRLGNLAVNAGQVVLSDPAADLPRRYAVVPSGAVQAPASIHMVVPLASTAGADEIMITPKEFIADLGDLVALRQSQGISVVVEDVQAIYDAYDGRPQPEAIKSFLTDAYNHWNPRPVYVLLVGDGTSDPRRYRSDSTQTWIPPFLVEADPIIGEIAADNRYAAIDGNDNLPDMWIGRLPVNSHVEAAITLTKIVQYDRSPQPGPWSRQMAFVGDKVDPGTGDFPGEIASLVDAYQDSRYTINHLAFDSSIPQNDFHQNVLNQWNQGNSIILYTGHGSTHQWGAEVIFHINDLPYLTNGSRLPVLLEMTCLTGSFQVPNMPTLDETLLRRSGKGAVAVWGSTGLGLSSGTMLLAKGFLDQVMAENKSSLGKATLQGRLNLVAHAPVLGYLLDTYTLFGDPAMRLSYRNDTYLPALNR